MQCAKSSRAFWHLTVRALKGSGIDIEKCSVHGGDHVCKPLQYYTALEQMKVEMRWFGIWRNRPPGQRRCPQLSPLHKNLTATQTIGVFPQNAECAKLPQEMQPAAIKAKIGGRIRRALWHMCTLGFSRGRASAAKRAGFLLILSDSQYFICTSIPTVSKPLFKISHATWRMIAHTVPTIASNKFSSSQSSYLSTSSYIILAILLYHMSSA